MIKDFDTVRAQLKELAEVINAFKSEAVQLRIVDLIIGGAPLAAKLESTAPTPIADVAAKPTRARKRARKAAATNPSDQPAKPARSPAKGRPSGKVTLDSLVSEGFFKSPKTIGQMVEHCDTSLAMKYRQSDFSGPLMRLVREKRLTRKKNTDGQYEYISA
jgi:hypothetical protein